MLQRLDKLIIDQAEKSIHTVESDPPSLSEERIIVKTYYETGELKAETPYLLGKKHGIEREYYENGKLKWKRQYRYGEIYGVQKYYDND